MPYRMPNTSRLLSLTLLAMLTSSIAGCSTVPGNCSALPLKEYPRETELVIAAQIQQAPPELKGFAVEASTLRGAVRTCKKG